MQDIDGTTPHPLPSQAAEVGDSDKILSLMLIEDNPADVSLFKMALKRCSHKTDLVMCGSAIEGLQELQKSLTAPDLIVLDLNLPMMDGFEFLREYRQFPNPANVVVFTSSSRAEDVVTARELGAVGLIEKPADFWAFSLAVHRIVHLADPSIECDDSDILPKIK